MPYPNEHAARLVEPDRFDPNSFRRENDKFGEGIHAVFGKLKGEDAMTLQAIRFDAGRFTADEASKWLEEHDYKPIDFEEAAGEEKAEKAASGDRLESLSYFIPLQKVDEARREVWGVAAIEQPDQSGEIMDYEKSKPHFWEWSKRVEKASGGKSRGNVRDSHTAKAVGKVVKLLFDDAAKAVRVGVKILDSEAWQKVAEGVFTGFSIGGRYGERWPDPLNKGLTRYVAIPSEISLVDLPCIPGAQFEMVKADGSVTSHDFSVVSNRSKGETMKDKIQNILKKQLGDLSEEELKALAEEVAAVVEEEKPEQEQPEEAAPEGEAQTDGEEPQPEEQAEEQPKPLTAEDVRALVLSILEEIGLLESAGGAMQMSAKPGELKKSLEVQKANVEKLQKSLDDLRAQLVNDVARLAVEVETLSKRGGAGPVLRELGALDAKTSAALQQAESVKKALETVTDPLAAQALRNEIAKLEIQAVHQTQK